MNNNKHIRFLKLAKEISELSDFKAHQIGCVLITGKQILSVACNLQKTHPLQMEYNRYRNLKGGNVIHKAHAETLCLSKAKNFGINFNNTTLYIFRQLKNKQWAIAKPCNGCMELIKNLGIKKIVYSVDEGYAIEFVRKI